MIHASEWNVADKI